MVRYSLKEIASLLHLEINVELNISGFATDSRQVQPQNLFVALKGERVDGHQYLAEVAKNGATAAIVSKSYQGPSYGMVLLYQDDPLAALQAIAKGILAARNPQIIALTGSVGKTTTKEFIATLLGTKYRVSATPGNQNSQVGLPLTLLNHTDGKEEVLVLEMGLTHSGQIARLIDIAPPHIALITSITLSHACNFESLADIARAKGEIFLHPKTTLGIYPLEQEFMPIWNKMGTCKKTSFSVTYPLADYFLEELNDKFLKIKDSKSDATLPPLPVLGKHNITNFLAAVAVARSFKLGWNEIKQGLESLALPKMRLEIIEKKGITFINDAYNANETSMKAALESIPEPKKGRKRIAVFGEMLELGRFSEQCHREVGKFALGRVDQILCFGEECRPICDCWSEARLPATLYKDQHVLIEALRKIVQEGDVVLLKGSRSKQMWKVLDEF